MKYRPSILDQRNFKWFQNDHTRASLVDLSITYGSIRGLSDLSIPFSYPITAIAGANGSGKTTILALAACGFHSQGNGYKPRGRSQTYYTFSDFFLQATDEVPLEGVNIWYLIRYDKWWDRTTKTRSAHDGLQVRRKKRGGRWNDYDLRVDRPVIYLGMNRLVPHAEKSTSRSYKSLFSKASASGWEDELRERVGRILAREYTDIEFREHSRYRLAVVKWQRMQYSGFNMGAGEDGLFELISACLDCPEGALLLVDEIELGLHEKAQERLIQELKELCLMRKLQIICTTHSGRVLESLPPEGRILLERNSNSTRVTLGPSAKLATGKLSGRLQAELTIFVEDDVAEALLGEALSFETRSRIQIHPAGSKHMVLRHLATHYCEGNESAVCAMLDGDCRAERRTLCRSFMRLLESKATNAARHWFLERASFLPGSGAPEGWLFSIADESLVSRLSSIFRIDSARASAFLEAARMAGTHDRVHELGRCLLVPERSLLLHHLAAGALEGEKEEAERLESSVSKWLD